VIQLRRWWRPLVGLLLAALFLSLLARNVEWAEVRQVLAGARWPALALAVLALAADMSCRIIRWWLMLRPMRPDLPWTSCIRPFLGSLALNNTVPLRAGDVIRVVGFQRALGTPAGYLAGTLILERILDLLVLLTILFLTVLGVSTGFPRPFLVIAAAAGAVCLALLVAITLMPERITGLTQSIVRRVFGDSGWTSSFCQVLLQLTGALALLRSPGRAVKIFGLSALAWALEGAVFACTAWSLQIQVAGPAPWLALSAATLATLLPSSPGYVGTFDYFASLGLAAYGADRASAAAFALLSHLVLWLPVTAAGFVALLISSRPGTSVVTAPADSSALQ
jgi:glycosyltransferase 2 family protein